MNQSPRPPHPAVRVVRALGRALFWGVIVCAALIGIALFTLDTPWGRGKLLGYVNSSLEGSFRGKIRLDALANIDVTGFRGIHGSVSDVRGNQVIEISDLSIQFDWLQLLGELLGDPEVTIRLNRLSIGHARVELIDTGGGVPSLAQAFESTDSGPPSEGSTRFHIDQLVFDHVWAHGILADFPIDAELADFTGSLSVTAAFVNIGVEGTRLRARALPQQLNPVGKLRGRLDIPLDANPSPFAARAAFSGQVRSTPVSATFTLHGEQQRASIVASRVAPELIRELVPQSRWTKPLGIELTTRGTLERPEFRLEAALDTTSLDADGFVDLERDTAHVRLRVEGLDLSQVDKTAPMSSLTVSLDASFENLTHSPSASYAIHIAPGVLAGQQLPQAQVAGLVSVEHNGNLSAQGAVQVTEPGAPAVVAYSLIHNLKEGLKLRSTASAEFDAPPRLKRLTGAEVRGSVRVEAEYIADSGALTGSVAATLPELNLNQLSLQRTQLRATLSGNTAEPTIDLDASIAKLMLADRQFENVSITARGTPAQLKLATTIAEPRRIRASAVVRLSPELQVVSPRVVVEGQGSESLTASGTRISVNGRGSIVADEITVNTPNGGSASVSAKLEGAEQSVRFTANELDIAHALELLNLQHVVPVPQGRIVGRGHYETRGAAREGSLHVTWRQLEYGRLKGATAEIHAELHSNQIDGELRLEWKDSVVRLKLREVELPRRMPSAVNDLQGYARADLDLELQDAEPFLDLAKIPVETARGELRGKLELERGESVPGRLSLNLETSGLELVGVRRATDNQTTSVTARAAAPWSVSALDLALSVTADAATREFALRANVIDRTGKLVASEAHTELPVDVLQRKFDTWSTGWQQQQVTARVWVLPRALSEWPSVARIPDVDGTFSASIEFQGTYESPSLRVMGRARDLGPATGESRLLGVDFSGHYTKSSGALRAQATSRRREVANLYGAWQGDAAHYFTTGGRAPQLQLRVDLDHFPLAALPRLAQQDIKGNLDGQLRIERLEPLEGTLQVSSDDLQLASLRSERTLAEVVISPDEVDIQLWVGGPELGRISASVSGEAAALGDLSRLQARLDATAFQLKTLRPLLAGSVDSLDGRLDAKLSGRLSPTDPDLRGRVRISNAEAQLPALGQRLSAINATLLVQPNRIELSRLQAKGTTGQLNATGSAVLDGFSLKSARANLKITEEEKLPLTVQGVALGDIWGTAALEYSALSRNRQRLNVDLQHFEVELPQVTPYGVQSLDPARNIDVGFVRDDGKFVSIPLQPVEREAGGRGTRWRIMINLGNIVVHKGPGIELKLGGKLEARLSKKTRLDGKIELQGGTLDVSGKEFTVESGSVTFDGTEAEGGVVVARARWDSPLDYTVYAEYNGTVQEGELSLRSEPPLSEDEILSLLMFGSPSGSFGADSKSEAATAIGVAGGTVTRGLNRALADISQLEVSTRIDTSAGEARPELVVQLSPRVTGRVTQAIGEPSPGQSPDRTFFTVELRLFRRWSLSAEVGDEGRSALDLIWRHQF